MNRILKAALVAAAVPAYLIVGLYVSVGIGNATHSPANTTFAALAWLVAGIMALAKVAGRRRSRAQA